MYKNNSRNSSNFKGCSPLQHYCNLIGKCHAAGYYSYTYRCMQVRQSDIETKKLNNVTVEKYRLQYKITDGLVWCSVDRLEQCEGIYFVFSPPAQRQKKPSPQNSTFANHCMPALQTKVYKRAVFCPCS